MLVFRIYLFYAFRHSLMQCKLGLVNTGSLSLSYARPLNIALLKLVTYIIRDYKSILSPLSRFSFIVLN